MPDVRLLATALAANRIAFGAGLVLTPGLHGRTWVGRAARDERTQVLARALGVRDLAIGTAALLSLRSGDARRVRESFAVQVVTDTIDLLATLAAGSRMPGPQRAFAASVALASIGVAAATAADADGVASAEGPSGRIGLERPARPAA